ncbi:DNA adenine methylase [Pontibacter populi]|uniref:site-specific DNA-methyltransferase (adenine-specific) n=1 Tax=Pontibacter populi TaxID=890055 RepID=A0ABV1RYG3_9BACT
MGFRYIGSKDKLSDIIISEIKSINNEACRVIDLMAGTGLFSLALKESNYCVTAVDVMTYSFHHLNVHLNLVEAPDFNGINSVESIINSKPINLFGVRNYDIILSYLNSLKPVKGYFYQEFSPEGTPSNTSKPRKYFTSKNAAKIDAIRGEIKRLKSANTITDIEHSLLLHDLIMAVNDVANIAGTYGHYLSKFVKRAEAPIELYPSTFSGVGRTTDHKIYRGYAEEVSKHIEGDVCYIDPPYIKRQYAANYHILETLAREDEPEAIGDSGLRPWRDQYSNFCSKVKIRDSFDQILTNINCQDILISYSEDGLLPIDDLVSFLQNYGSVIKKDIQYKRFKSNDSKKAAKLNEFLIHLHKN